MLHTSEIKEQRKKRGLCWGNGSNNNDNDNQTREPPALGTVLQGTISKSLTHEDKETRLLRIGANVFASLRMWRWWCICVTLLAMVEVLDVSSLFSFWKPVGWLGCGLLKFWVCIRCVLRENLGVNSLCTVEVSCIPSLCAFREKRNKWACISCVLSEKDGRILWKSVYAFVRCFVKNVATDSVCTLWKLWVEFIAYYWSP